MITIYYTQKITENYEVKFYWEGYLIAVFPAEDEILMKTGPLSNYFFMELNYYE